jgi:hypothetical protein
MSQSLAVKGAAGTGVGALCAAEVRREIGEPGVGRRRTDGAMGGLSHGTHFIFQNIFYRWIMHQTDSICAKNNILYFKKNCLPMDYMGH